MYILNLFLFYQDTSIIIRSFHKKLLFMTLKEYPETLVNIFLNIKLINENLQ